MKSKQDTKQNSPSMHSTFSVFLIFLRLGLTSFGGPIAHIGYFRDEFVARKKWLSDQAYSEIVALCQFLPGPASSQVGLAIGLSQAGYRGAFAAWLGFTLPSAIIMTLAALGCQAFSENNITGLIHGLKIVAVAIIAQAIWGMAQSLCPDNRRRLICALAIVIVLFIPNIIGQLIAITVCGLLGLSTIHADGIEKDQSPLTIMNNKKTGITFLLLFFVLLLGLPLVSYWIPSQSITNFESFYRAGSLVFGGGHVVLPLLQSEVVNTGLVNNETFLAGYGAAQAVPGPLFTFASFLGGSMYSGNLVWYGSLICLIAIFLPAFLLIAGVLPFWQLIRSNVKARSALAGANAGVVGLLIAVLYNPVWTSTVHNLNDLGLVVAAFCLLTFAKLPSWVIVFVFSIVGGFFLS